MDKFLAIFAVALGMVYSDLDSGDLYGRFVFPLLLISGIAYLFWFKGLVAISAGGLAVYHMDITSPSIFQSIVLPLFIVICVVYLLIWLHGEGFFDSGHGSGFDTGSDGSSCNFGESGGCDGGGGD